MKLKRSDILKVAHTRAVEFHTAASWRVTGISTDSRTTKTGDLFIALRGDTFDGHDFISAAVQSGASGLVVDKRWADANEAMMARIHVPTLVVENTLDALGALARIYRSTWNIPVLAVAGSNGKTTTKEMIKVVLEKKFNVLATEGNLNNHIGVPLTMFRLERKHGVAVVEIGTNHPGEISALCSVLLPTHGLITNIGREHLEFFGSLDGVAKAEGELYDYLGVSRGVAFVNGSDLRVQKRVKKASVKRKVVYGLGTGRAHVRGSVRQWTADARPVLVIRSAGKKSFEVTLAVPGGHNALNAIAAAAVGLTFGVSPENIRQALESFTAVGKRMQAMERHGVTILNDVYNSNPDSVRAGLSTLRALKNKGKKVAVLADMLELGSAAEKEHRAVGKLLKNFGVGYLLTFGPLSRFTHEAAAVEFKQHYEQKNLLSESLLEMLKPDDAVLVKGSRGMKMEEVVNFLSERLLRAA